MTKLHLAVITAHKSKAHLVREAVAGLGFAFQESPVPSEEDVVKFHFGELSDDDTMKLLNAVPREAYYFNGIITK